ncbi:ABC transporter permease [Nonomuraea sp. NPDC050451]|uniref:ABC transporter permease n=1 Tax=Nonomuraea sp. NPDC050451 TaxID=3364364 RepID=UPI0037930B29
MISTWLRLELRRRWRSLLVLALLVAFAGGTVLASLAGARRGDTAIDRLAARTLPLTIVVLPNQPGFDWAAVAALPEVETLTQFPVSGFGVAGIPNSAQISAFPPADGNVLNTIERPVVIEGRMADPARADEVMVTSQFLTAYHKKVGDRLTLELMSGEQASSDDYDPATEPMKGPRVPATIVGVIRSPWFSDKIVGDRGVVVPTPGLYAAYKENILGPNGYVNAMVRLKDGRAGLEAFRRDLAVVSKRSDIDIWDWELKWVTPARNLNHFEAASLLAFGLAALAAAIVLVGQSIARYTAATMVDLRLLRAVGMTPRQAVGAASAGPFLAALAGSTLAVVAAAVASIWMPIGAAALYEPEPGFDIDWLVLGGGWLFIPLLVLAGTAAAAALLRRTGEHSGRRSAVAMAASRAGLPVPFVVGARFALEPGRGRGAVPVRPALFGAIAGVFGVLAAFTFSAGVNDAAEHPIRFGQAYQLETFLGLNGQEFVPVDKVLAEVAKDPDVIGVNDGKIAVAESPPAGAAGEPGVSVTAYTFRPVGRPIDVLMLDGRLPSSAEEIALAPVSASQFGVKVGDRVTLGGGQKTTRLTVTGISFLPMGPHNDYSDGAWVTPAGYDALFGGAHYPFKFHVAEVALRPGADLEKVRARLTAVAAKAAGRPGVAFTDPLEIQQVRQIRDVQALPLLLAGFLALLALGAVGHALATAVRRRRHEVAVLRALGMTRWQARWAVVTQATLLASAGLAFGVPLGLAVGRTLWRVVADIMPLAYVPPVAVWALLLVGPLTLLLANLLAAWPGRMAGQLRIGHVLRAE